MLKKVKIIIVLVIVLLSIKTISYATIRGDVDNSMDVTAFDAYLTLKKSLEDEFEESVLQLIDIDCDTLVTVRQA